MRRFRTTPTLQLRLPGHGVVTVFVAEALDVRLIGLAGLPTLEVGRGLLIPHCTSVHTFGMRFPIDVLFLAGWPGRFEVVDRRAGVRPGRVVRASRTARSRPPLAAVELPLLSGRARPGRRRVPGRA